MRRFAVPAVVAAVAVGLLVVLAVAISGSGANNSIAYSVQSGHYRRAPKYDAQLPVMANGSGTSVSLAGLRGKLVLVNFFASWCEPCQAEAPVLAQAQRVLAAHDGTVVGIAFQNSPSAALTYLHQYNLGYPALTDPEGHEASAWGITQVPDSYLIDRQGKIVWLNTYQLTPSFLNRTLPKLIAEYST